MAYTVRFNWEKNRSRELRDRLHNIAMKTPIEAGKALEAEGRRQLELARDKTPFDSGDLFNSGRVTDVQTDRHDLIVTIGFGGPGNAIPYAIAQHVRNYDHDIGERGWLLKTVRRERGRMLRELARELKLT